MCTTLDPTWMFASVLFQCVANHCSVLSCPFPWIQVLGLCRIVAFDLRLLRTDGSVCGVSLGWCRVSASQLVRRQTGIFNPDSGNIILYYNKNSLELLNTKASFVITTDSVVTCGNTGVVTCPCDLAGKVLDCKTSKSVRPTSGVSIIAILRLWGIAGTSMPIVDVLGATTRWHHLWITQRAVIWFPKQRLRMLTIHLTRIFYFRN